MKSLSETIKLKATHNMKDTHFNMSETQVIQTDMCQLHILEYFIYLLSVKWG